MSADIKTQQLPPVLHPGQAEPPLFSSATARFSGVPLSYLNLHRQHRVLRKDLGARRITVNAIGPDLVDTDSFSNGKSRQPIPLLASL